MRKALTLDVCQNCFYAFRLQFKLFRNFGDAYTIVVVFDDCLDRHPSATEDWSSALDSLFHFD